MITRLNDLSLSHAAELCSLASSCRDVIESRIQDYRAFPDGSNPPKTFDVYELEGQRILSNTGEVAIL